MFIFSERKVELLMKQVVIQDLENKVKHGGILLDNGDIVCGCCGGLIEKSEICYDSELENTLSELGIQYSSEKDNYFSHRIIKIYPEWKNIDNEIM